ncbi:MAG: site-specific DNA-methyltransferase [Desulfurellales bacterium]|nr:MAG: site-specific DNA-methyltransferase [Desulfurellales bacterium]
MSVKPYYFDDLVTLYHGDCREILPMVSADVLVTDPPYGTRVDRDGYGRRQIHHGEQHIENDHDLSCFDAAIAATTARRAVAFSSPKRTLEMLSIFTRHGWGVAAEFVWDKLSPGLGGGIRYQHENAYIVARDAFVGGSSISSVLRFASVSRGGKHPHEKPIDLMMKLIEYVGDGEIVDPFAGSGSTLVAAADLNRKAIGIEIEERYCEIAARRLESRTPSLFRDH